MFHKLEHRLKLKRKPPLKRPREKQRQRPPLLQKLPRELQRLKEQPQR
jgi:hypothetical protein